MSPTLEQRREIYAALAAPLPPEAVERSSTRQTRRGFDMAGYRVQFVVNRLNDVLGLGGWGTAEREYATREIPGKNGPEFEVVCSLVLELGTLDRSGRRVAWAREHGDGGYTSASLGDARKGAFSNALKRAAAMFGVGRAAYEGGLDGSVDQAEPPPPTEERPMRRAHRGSGAADEAPLTEEQLQAAVLWRARFQGAADRDALEQIWRELIGQQGGGQTPLCRALRGSYEVKAKALAPRRAG